MSKTHNSKMIDKQFYEGKVMSIKQALLVVNDNSQIDIIQNSIPKYELKYMTNPKNKLSSINTQIQSRNRIQSVCLNTIDSDKQKQESYTNQIIEQLKTQIFQLQQLINEIFIVLKENEFQNLQILSELHQQYIQILNNKDIKQQDEQKSKYFFYYDENQIYGLTKQKINDDTFKSQEYDIQQKIKEIQIFHIQGICNELKLIMQDDTQLQIGNQSNIVQQFQQEIITFTDQQLFQSIFFSQGNSTKLIGHYIQTNHFLINSIQQFNLINDNIQSKYTLHDLNILTKESQIVGIQGIYRVQDQENSFIEGKPFINSQFLNSKMDDFPYNLERQLQQFEIYQNTVSLTIDKIILKYLIYNQINKTTSKLQIEFGILKQVKYKITTHEIVESKLLKLTYAILNELNYLTNIELI